METRTSALGRSSATRQPIFPRILSLPPGEAVPRRKGTPSFDHALLAWDAPLGSAASQLPDLSDLPAPLLRLRLDRFALDDPLVARFPEAFAVRREASSEAVLDPRRPAPAQGQARARIRRADLPGEVEGAIRQALGDLLHAGARGFLVDAPEPRAAAFYERLFTALRARFPEALFIAATQGQPREGALALAGAGFDYLLSSFAWWDLRARWLAEEHAALSPLCPLIAEITPAAAARATDPEQVRALLAAAAFSAAGVIAPLELVGRYPDASALLAAGAQAAALGGAIRPLASAGSAVSAFARFDAASAREARGAMLLLVNTSATPADVPPSLLAGFAFPQLSPVGSGSEPLAPLKPYEARLLRASAGRAVAIRATGARKSAAAAAGTPRIVIENLSPFVSGGPFPVKRVVGDTVRVTADIYTDGHEKVGAELLWRAETDEGWHAVPMVEEGNDVWSATFTLPRLGRHEFTVEAWDDRFGYYRESLVKKVVAGVAAPVDFMEGRAFLERALKRASPEQAAMLRHALAELEDCEEDAESADILAAPALAEVMYALDPRHHRTVHLPQPIDAERLETHFSAWYELFPRSMVPVPEAGSKPRHGTLRDVIDHLPRVAAMGFDTLYFPPIHPIGRANRKGPNNTLTPGPDDPGSPYAIGGEAGGHDALHPELGTFEDFRALVAAAKEHGLELALDFAIQCSPDHPWLKDHSGWFAWRPDGSMKYAENPPKKYQDIVNVDFYGPDAVPELWIALRDVILLWVGEGVKVFRVDNPHTKPLPFWEWMIRQVRSQHPDVIFLSEAFTRPKVMYRLAKLGFSQSYTYFTWRNTKAELTEYIEELTGGGTPGDRPRDFFRPHFFVNTPDINPVFLQTGGRAAHRIRAVLAATLSGLWGVYSGFELCDAAPLPGKEEYLDSEKYEVRPREWRAPGDIVDDITLLNRLRRGHPGLQTHLNTRFYQAYDDNILYYGKPAPDGGDMILVAINLDPHGAHGCDFELPLWEFGQPDHGSVAAEDLRTGERFTWTGKLHQLYLTPDDPYRIWRIEPLREALHG
jgi:starch synthase (maltosyl-transferring)